MCCLRATTSVFVHYFRICKHVLELFSSAICSSEREVVFNQKTRKKNRSVAELATKLINFLCGWAASTYTLCFEMPLCLLLSFSPPCSILKSISHKLHKVKPPPFWNIRINLNSLYRECWNFTNNFFFFESFDFFSRY